ncbi:MAG: hypothetical protein PHG36_02525 [Dehalococcoidia bacterium]|nr:hypothetical protein [Dehalococcoidia bacterium]
MTNNWPTFFQHNIRPPDTIAEAVDRLMMILDGEQKIALTVMRENELIDLHFSLGMSIRNVFRLHVPGSKLLASCGVGHPDDASGVIIQALWVKLTRGTQWT